MINDCLISQTSLINWWVVSIFILGILPQVFLSSADGTFFAWQYRQVDLPLSWHWGVLIGDPILAIFMGRIWSDLHFNLWSIFFLIVSMAISAAMHNLWRGISGHMFYQCLLVPAGWCHFVYTVIAMELILEFIFTPMPRGTIMAAAFILLIFAPFAVFEPGWAEWQRKKLRKPDAKWFWQSFISLIGMWAAIFVVAYCKI